MICRNPFVNQVSFFAAPDMLYALTEIKSQSLRKSGQFLYAQELVNQPVALRRNPFVNQVSFFVKSSFTPAICREGRNPFVNQVSFFS